MSGCASRSPLTGERFELADARARDQHRVLVTAFDASWCGPCRRMEHETWPDPEIARWIADSAVAIRVDADGRSDLKDTLEVSALPTVIVFRDGGEVARLSGYYTAPELLGFLKSAERGRSRLEQLTDQLASTSDPAPQRELRLNALAEAIRIGDSAIAIGYWQQLWPHRPEMPSDQRFQFQIQATRLARLGPQAREAVNASRNSLEPQAMTSELDGDTVEDWLATCRAVGADATIAEWYAADPNHPDRAGALKRDYRGMWSSLMAAHRYDAILHLTRDDPAGYARTILSRESFVGPAIGAFEWKRLRRENTQPIVIDLYEACLGLHRDKDAQEVRQIVLRTFSDDQTRRDLEQAATRARQDSAGE